MNPILKEAIYYVIVIDDVDDYDGNTTVESLDNAEWWMLQSVDDYDFHLSNRDGEISIFSRDDGRDGTDEGLRIWSESLAELQKMESEFPTYAEWPSVTV